MRMVIPWEVTRSWGDVVMVLDYKTLSLFETQALILGENLIMKSVILL